MARSFAFLLVLAPAAVAKDAFVFLGATGNNALRPAGVWQGLYEAFAGGVFSKETVGIHAAINAPNTASTLQQSVIASLTPLYQELQNNSGWKCMAKDGDCTPMAMFKDVQVNAWNGYHADAHAANMTAALAEYKVITTYLSIPPSVFAEWSKAAVQNWGNGSEHRVHVAAEKPFGTSLVEATQLHQSIIDAGVPEDNLHLVDHWLSFFMNKNLPTFRPIVEDLLGIEFGTKSFSSIVITEYETRGLDGRGGFFDKVGQVRDMVQSHLLQVMALTLIDPKSPDLQTWSETKLSILQDTKILDCQLAQYEGFLLEPKLGFHNASADATLCKVALRVGLEEWKDVAITIQTGKDMGEVLYTVDFYQRGGKGVLSYDVGKEETGVAGIRVKDWPLKSSTSFQAPLPGLMNTKTMTVEPQVHSGNGYILNYSNPEMYFPKPYTTMIASLLHTDYSFAFVTWPECQASWTVVTGTGNSECLDPAPERVEVYSPPATCGNKPPNVCFKRGETVKTLYDVTFACTREHDREYKNVSLYQAKCHPTPPKDLTIVV